MGISIMIGSAPDSWGRDPGFESGISHNDKVVNLREERDT